MASHASPRWQYTSAICPKCRTLTFADRHCDEPPLELALARHLDAFTDRIWGPPVVPDRTLEVTIGGLLGGAAVLGFFVMLAIMAARPPGHGDMWLVGVAGLSLIAVGFVGVVLRSDGRRRSGLPERNTGGSPTGGRPPIRNIAPLPVTGVIADGAQLPSPLSGRPCVAYSAVVTCGKAKVLRAACTIGFAIETNDGQHIDVPAGEIALASDSGDPVEVDAVDGFLASGLPVVEGLAGEPLFPHDAAVERVLVPGDTIRIHSHIAERPGGAAGYRDQAGPALQIAGVPVVEII